MISRTTNTTVTNYEKRGSKEKLGFVWKRRHGTNSVSIITNEQFKETSV